MSHALSRTTLTALATAALVVGCGKGDKAADTARAADSATAATSAPPAAAAPAPMSDANILAALDHANMADSTTGSMASTKGTAADVKAFGREMMRDHHALRAEGQALAKKLAVTPAAAPGDSTEAKDKAVADSLTAMPAGPAWDKFYIDHEVTGHQEVLATAQNAMSATQNAEIKAMLTKAAPIVQAHLDKAKAIQAKAK